MGGSAGPSRKKSSYWLARTSPLPVEESKVGQYHDENCVREHLCPITEGKLLKKLDGAVQPGECGKD